MDNHNSFALNIFVIMLYCWTMVDMYKYMCFNISLFIQELHISFMSSINWRNPKKYWFCDVKWEFTAINSMYVQVFVGKCIKFFDRFYFIASVTRRAGLI